MDTTPTTTTTFKVETGETRSARDASTDETKPTKPHTMQTKNTLKSPFIFTTAEQKTISREIKKTLGPRYLFADDALHLDDEPTFGLSKKEEKALRAALSGMSPEKVSEFWEE